VLNGPNLDLLGTSESKPNGHASCADVEWICTDDIVRCAITGPAAKKLGAQGESLTRSPSPLKKVPDPDHGAPA
jgi:3-dehydroquinate dehydratase